MWSILRFMQESSHSSSLLNDTYSFISINTHDSFLFSFPFIYLFQWWLSYLRLSTYLCTTFQLIFLYSCCLASSILIIDHLLRQLQMCPKARTIQMSLRSACHFLLLELYHVCMHPQLLSGVLSDGMRGGHLPRHQSSMTDSVTKLPLSICGDTSSPGMRSEGVNAPSPGTQSVAVNGSRASIPAVRVVNQLKTHETAWVKPRNHDSSLDERKRKWFPYKLTRIYTRNGWKLSHRRKHHRRVSPRD